MNNNTLVSDRLNELYKKYFQSTDYKVGDSFESVKANMSAEDYDISQKLINYYSQQNSLSGQYNYSNKVVEQERNKALQENSIAKEKTMKYLPEYLIVFSFAILFSCSAKEKTMKYLPEYLKLQGMGGLGLSESSIISANNNYRNQRNTINANTDSQKADLLEKYNANINTLDQNAITDLGSIRAKYQAIRDEEILGQYNTFVGLLNNDSFKNMDEVNESYNKIKDSLSETQRTNAENQIAAFGNRLQKQESDQLYNNFIYKLNDGEFNTTEELENYYNSIKDKFDDTQTSIIEDKIAYYKNNPDHQEIDNEIKEQQKQEDSREILSGKKYLNYNGQDYQITSEALAPGESEYLYVVSNALLGTNNPYSDSIQDGTSLSYADVFKQYIISQIGEDDYNNNVLYGIYRKTEKLYRDEGIYLTYYDGNWYKSTKR